jgi:hypothetical protein
MKVKNLTKLYYVSVTEIREGYIEEFSITKPENEILMKVSFEPYDISHTYNIRCSINDKDDFRVNSEWWLIINIETAKQKQEMMRKEFLTEKFQRLQYDLSYIQENAVKWMLDDYYIENISALKGLENIKIT